MSGLTTENALEVMGIIGLIICLIGLVAGLFVTIPTTVRDLRGASRDRPESVVYRYDLYGAVLGVLGLLAMLGVVITVLATEPGVLRSVISRPGILVTLACLTGVCILAPLRRRAIGQAADRDEVRDADRDIERDASRNPQRDKSRDIGRDPARDIDRDKGRDTYRDSQRDPGRDAGRDAEHDSE